MLGLKLNHVSKKDPYCPLDLLYAVTSQLWLQQLRRAWFSNDFVIDTTLTLYNIETPIMVTRQNIGLHDTSLMVESETQWMNAVIEDNVELLQNILSDPSSSKSDISLSAYSNRPEFVGISDYNAWWHLHHISQIMPCVWQLCLTPKMFCGSCWNLVSYLHKKTRTKHFSALHDCLCIRPIRRTRGAIY